MHPLSEWLTAHPLLEWLLRIVAVTSVRVYMLIHSAPPLGVANSAPPVEWLLRIVVVTSFRVYILIHSAPPLGVANFVLFVTYAFLRFRFSALNCGTLPSLWRARELAFSPLRVHTQPASLVLAFVVLSCRLFVLSVRRFVLPFSPLCFSFFAASFSLLEKPIPGAP